MLIEAIKAAGTKNRTAVMAKMVCISNSKTNIYAWTHKHIHTSMHPCSCHVRHMHMHAHKHLYAHTHSQQSLQKGVKKKGKRFDDMYTLFFFFSHF